MGVSKIKKSINKAIVYGCGYAGKIMVNYLLNKDIDVICIMVSPGHREIETYDTITINGKKVTTPVIELNENLNLEYNKIYITVVAGKDIVINNLNEMGYKNYVIIEDLANYEDTFIKGYLSGKNIDITKEIIEFGNVKIYNPLLKDELLKKSFYETFGDELLPGIYNDYSLVVDGAYENGEITANPGEYIIDAGANIGLFACYAAAKGCKVFACEPGSKSLEILDEQRKLYDLINIIPLGLSDESGQIDFYESEDSVLDSIYMPRGNTTKRTIEIDTIDNLVSKGIIPHVDYIKADIEGAERYMLRGAKETLRKMAPKLSICTYHYKDDPEVIEEIIKEANSNYIIEHKWRKLYAYVPK